MKRIIFFAFLIALTSIGNSLCAENFVVVIDPGHGGRDGGATRGKYKEKDINLAVALNLGKLIEDSFSDVKVIYTRKTDVAVALDERAKIANKAKANLFISIHTNSTDAVTTSALGADTYILGLARTDENIKVQQRENSVVVLEDNYKQRYQGFDPNSPESHIIFEFMTNKYIEQSLEFATEIQKNFKTIAKRKDRGVRQAGFLVLRDTAMPSVLVELGFINNPAEAKYLVSTIGQRTLASAIFAGFKSYKKEFDKKQSSKSITSDNKESSQNTIIKPKEVTPAASKQVTQPVKESSNDSSGFVSKPKQDMTVVTKQTVNTPAEKPKTPVVAQSVKDVKPSINPNEIEYRVQLFIARTEVVSGSPQLKGLSPVSFYIDNGVYKYTYGSTTNRDEAVRIQHEVRSKFGDAFIIEFRNGQRIK